MPYLEVKIGHKEHEGILVKGLKDSGCNRSCIEEKVWLLIPDRHLIPTTKFEGFVTVANGANAPILLLAHITVTFYSKNGKTLALLLPFYVVRGLAHELYIGNDILTGSHKIAETSDALLLSSDPAKWSSFTLPKDDSLFEIEIKGGAKQNITALSYTDYINFICTLELSSDPPDLSVDEHLPHDHQQNYFPISSICTATDSSDLVYNINEATYNPKNDTLGVPSNSQTLQVFESKEIETFSPEQLIDGLQTSHLSPADAVKVKTLFSTHIEVLAKNEFDVTHTPILTAVIDIKSERPEIQNSYYIPIKNDLKSEADKLIGYYLEKGILQICDEHTPFISNLIFVKKKTGKLRAILDARIINQNTKKLSMSLTSHQEILALMSGKNHLTSLDIANAYFSIALSKDTSKYTSFYDHRKRRLSFKSCPQGWINSSYYLDQLLSMLFNDVRDCHWVADDIIIATNMAMGPRTFLQNLSPDPPQI